jgi:hypothetical protein
MQKHGVPSAKLKCLLSASQELMNPLNLLSRRKRMQALGFLMGVLKGEPGVARAPVKAEGR